MIARLRQEEGFTVMEVLIATLVGFVVLAAAMGLLESTVRLNTGVMGKTDAMQRGRLAMDKITQQLRSQVCLDLAPAPDGDSRTRARAEQLADAVRVAYVTLTRARHRTYAVAGRIWYHSGGGSAGIAQISEWVAALTSAHHVVAASLARANPPTESLSGACGTIRSSLA